MFTVISQLPVGSSLDCFGRGVHSMVRLKQIFFQEQELLQQHKIQEFHEHHVLFVY